MSTLCLIGCEESGTVREAFTAAGLDAWSCDLAPTRIPGQHLQCDILTVLEDGWSFALFHPPCDFFTVSGNRWFSDTAVAKTPGILTGEARRIAQQTVQPWWFGDPYFKATCLWLRGLPKLVPTNKLTPPAVGTDEHKRWSMIHRATPGKDRKRLRSTTFPGFAKAMAAQWSPIISHQ